jgi:PIN domain nuclease of toxin-antitoxin system
VKVLLDTHAFLWWMAGDARLSDRARTVMVDPDNVLLLSAASAWEIGMKVANGRLRIPIEPAALLAHVARDERLDPVAIGFDHALVAAALPPLHRDPFDRILVAQAQALGVPILTMDPDIARYPVETIW